MTVVSGVLIIDKPTGMTSHDVVNRVRRCLQTRKVGHAGTLDPDASGVLVVCVGDATRLLEYLTADAKTYEGTITFGIATDTDDATGTVTDRRDAKSLTEEAVRTAASALVGTYMQRVPAYSAVHIDGKRAYEWARLGQVPPQGLPEKEITIRSLEVLSFTSGTVASADFRVACSKGTYIRSLCRDWGTKVRNCAHMSALRRVTSGSFGLDSAVKLEEWLQSASPEQDVLPMESAVSHLPALSLDRETVIRLAHGQRVSLNACTVAGLCAVFDPDGRLWGIASACEEAGRVVICPQKMLVRPPGSVDSDV